jgi:hypothetical protein
MGKKKKELEARHAALARLAAQETAALMNRSIEMTRDRDKRQVYERISRMFDVDPADLDRDEGWKRAVKSAVEQMVAKLRESELNINFRAKDFFGSSKSQAKYTTKFETMRTAGAPMGDFRNQAEERMFQYSGNVGVDVASATPGEKAAALRAADYGDLTGPQFKGAIRPKYCSVNFAALVDGMGAQWGRSHIVLAEHLKPNMTFLHSDSFDVVLGSRVTTADVQGVMANYHHMHRLLANMSDSMLEAVADAATGLLSAGWTADALRKKYGLGATAYLEGHIHAEVYFSRDVKKLRICNAEVTTPDVKKNIAKFAGKYGVTVEYFD